MSWLPLPKKASVLTPSLSYHCPTPHRLDLSLSPDQRDGLCICPPLKGVECLLYASHFAQLAPFKTLQHCEVGIFASIFQIRKSQGG